MSGNLTCLDDFNDPQKNEERRKGWNALLSQAKASGGKFIAKGDYTVPIQANSKSRNSRRRRKAKELEKKEFRVTISRDLVLTDDYSQAHTVDELLGKGSFGHVYRSKQKIIFSENDLQTVLESNAVKIQVKQDSETEEQFKQRISHENLLQNDNAVPIKSSTFYEHNNKLYNASVMEVAPGENLKNFLERTPLTLEQRLTLAWEVVKQIKTVHSSSKDKPGVIHKDLKPLNLMCHMDDSGKITVTVLDFGVSKYVESSGNERSGTLGYMPPEVLKRNQKQTTKVDIYSLGIILGEIFGCNQKILFKHKRRDARRYTFTDPAAAPCFEEIFNQIEPYYMSSECFEDIKTELHNYLIKMTNDAPKARPDICETEVFLFEIKTTFEQSKARYEQKVAQLKDLKVSQSDDEKRRIAQVIAQAEVIEALRPTYERVDDCSAIIDERRREILITRLTFFRRQAEKNGNNNDGFKRLIARVDSIVKDQEITNDQLANLLEQVRVIYHHFQLQKSLEDVVGERMAYLWDLIPEEQRESKSQYTDEKPLLIEQLARGAMVCPPYVQQEDFLSTLTRFEKIKEDLKNGKVDFVLINGVSEFLKLEKKLKEVQEILSKPCDKDLRTRGLQLVSAATDPQAGWSEIEKLEQFVEDAKAKQQEYQQKIVQLRAIASGLCEPELKPEIETFIQGAENLNCGVTTEELVKFLANAQEKQAEYQRLKDSSDTSPEPSSSDGDSKNSLSEDCSSDREDSEVKSTSSASSPGTTSVSTSPIPSVSLVASDAQPVLPTFSTNIVGVTPVVDAHPVVKPLPTLKENTQLVLSALQKLDKTNKYFFGYSYNRSNFQAIITALSQPVEQVTGSGARRMGVQESKDDIQAVKGDPILELIKRAQEIAKNDRLMPRRKEHAEIVRKFAELNTDDKTMLDQQLPGIVDDIQKLNTYYSCVANEVNTLQETVCRGKLSSTTSDGMEDIRNIFKSTSKAPFEKLNEVGRVAEERTGEFRRFRSTFFSCIGKGRYEKVDEFYGKYAAFKKSGDMLKGLQDINKFTSDTEAFVRPRAPALSK